jgi:hypothetical protein
MSSSIVVSPCQQVDIDGLSAGTAGEPVAYIRLDSPDTPSVTVSTYYAVSAAATCAPLTGPSRVLSLRIPVDVTWYPQGARWVSINFPVYKVDETLYSPQFPGFGGGLYLIKATGCGAVPSLIPQKGDSDKYYGLGAVSAENSSLNSGYHTQNCSQTALGYFLRRTSAVRLASLAQIGDGDGTSETSDSAGVIVQVGLSSGVLIGIFVLLFVIMVFIAVGLGLYVTRGAV